MKHTDLYNKYRELEAIEREELKRAVLAHGGEFKFFDENGDEVPETNYPIVLAGNSHWSSNVDCIITRVAVVNDCLEIYGYDKEAYSDSELYLEDVSLGQLGYITDAIPETDEVKDVTVTSHVNELPVAKIGREDIEAAGYVSDITDEEFEQIAGKVRKYLEWQDFDTQLYNNIKSSCEYFDIQKIN